MQQSTVTEKLALSILGNLAPATRGRRCIQNGASSVCGSRSWDRRCSWAAWL